MASKTLFQKQADARTKTALKLRAKFDGRVRKYAAALGTALTGAADAKARVDRLNELYGVDISPETLLVHDVRTLNVGGTLAGLLAASTPGEEVQLFNPTVNGNEGGALDTEALFGEVEVVVTGDGGAKAPKAPKVPKGTGYNTTLMGPNQEAQGVTLAASAGDALGFNALLTGGAAPASMTLSWGGAEIASVALLDRYVGQPFDFTHNGLTRSGVFGAEVNLS